MSPLEHVAAAVADGRVTITQGETALGVILLLHASGPAAWSTKTYRRRRRLVEAVGIPTDHWPAHPSGD
jgi:hypothetical protein